MESLHNKFTQAYLEFLSYNLGRLVSFNTLFQSELPLLHQLKKEINSLIRNLPSDFLLLQYVRETEVKDINPRNDMNHVPLHKVYVGLSATDTVTQPLYESRMNWVYDPAPPASRRPNLEFAGTPAPAIAKEFPGALSTQPRQKKSWRRKRKNKRSANRNSAHRSAAPVTPDERWANENAASQSATQPKSAANDLPKMMSTPVYQYQSFHSSHLSQPPVPAANENSAFQFGLDRCKIPGLYKPTQPDPNGEPTHIRGGRLDLNFVSTFLRPNSSWKIHPTLMSDHYATCASLNMPQLPPIPPPPPTWNQNMADWHIFQTNIRNWAEQYEPSEDINQLELDLKVAIYTSADLSMPKKSRGNRIYTHKDAWYYCPEVRRLKTIHNRVKKNLQKKTHRGKQTSPPDS